MRSPRGKLTALSHATSVATVAAASLLVSLAAVAPLGDDAGDGRGGVTTVGDGASTHAVSDTGPGPVVRPTTPKVREFRVSEVEPGPTAARTAPGRTRALVATSKPRPVTGYGVVGATWEGPMPEGLELAVRTKDEDGTWSEWTDLEAEDAECAECGGEDAAAEHGPDPGTEEFESARPGTDALPVGEVAAVQLRVHSPRGSVPDDLTLAVVDPGPTVTEPADADDVAPMAAAVSTSSTLASPKPTIRSRAKWGADESMRSGKPSYGSVNAGFVHHTVNANGYTRTQVPGIIRGIYAYHTKSRGWSDIGYNFLVDRFGRIWEGRYGGVARAVVGAHTYGYNHLSFAMSAIGNFDTVEAPKAMVQAYGDLYAWKLELHGVKARSTPTLSGKKFNAISGHRDAGQTACPGRYLYDRLPAIRRRAANIQNGGVTTPVVPRGAHLMRDMDRDGRGDLLVRNRASGRLEVLAGSNGPGFKRAQVLAFGGKGTDLVTGVGDMTGDGVPDMITRLRRTGITQLRPGRPGGYFKRPVRSLETRKFRRADLLAGAGNIIGIKKPDVVMRHSGTGQLLVFPGRRDGSWGKRREVLANAKNLKSVVGAGDVNGDGRDDLIATAGKRLLLLPGRGRGKVGNPVVLSRKWGGKQLTVAGHDLTGDGVPDLLARDRATGRTWIYDVGADGRPGPRLGGWKSWSGVTQITAIGDPGTGTTRLVIRNSKRELAVVDSLGTGRYRQPERAGRHGGGMDFAQVAGDWDGDGITDVVARVADNGNIVLFPGNGDGTLKPRTRLWPGLTEQRDLVVTPDLTGDGLPDLIARHPDGSLWAYPSDGAGGRQQPVEAKKGLIRVDMVTPAGYWNDDGVRDLIVRRATDKRLYLVPGNADGTLANVVEISGSFAAYDRIVGTGDQSGDGRPDLVAREAATGRLWLFPGKADGRVGARRFLAPGLDRFDLIG